MTAFLKVKEQIKSQQRCWLVTGAAGFIGSHLAQVLLQLGQRVVAVDDFSTGKQKNLDEIKAIVGEEVWQNFRFIQGSIEDAEICKQACSDADLILHQAALGSVPRSIKDPVRSTQVNVGGFVQLVHQASLRGIKRFVYASSSSVYGDTTVSPKQEDIRGKLISPYAASKMSDELFAESCATVYGMEFLGLRYFNVFGPRQDPEGGYAAVIPKWIKAVVNQEQCVINGDGATSRDFCYIDNVVQANLEAAIVADSAALNTVYNIAVSEQTSLNQLFEIIVQIASERNTAQYALKPAYHDFRAGDVRHSLADISRAKRLLGYEPTHTVATGLVPTVDWFFERLRTK